MAAQQSVPAPDHAANAGVTPATSTGSETPPPYRLFNLVAEDSLKEKMNQYGATGYRFVGIATVEGGATQIVMEAAAGGPYEYEFASGSIFKHKLQESMNAAGARGFRLYPPSLRTTKWPTRLSTVCSRMATEVGTTPQAKALPAFRCFFTWSP